MKNIISLSVILLLIFQSCCYFDIEPSVRLKLTDEDMVIIPYEKGQQFNMIDQNNDTLLWIVNTDEIHTYRDGYMRTIKINTIDDSNRISMDLYPNKQLTIQSDYQYYFDFNNLSPRTLVLDNDTFFNVYANSYSQINFTLYYSFDKGIIRIQKDSNYLQLIP
ncbi:MAG: hypothetical protein IKS33_08200 [Bacteroidales bacterium]|nr:hypothetical protein [Bacteroidales bacterium]